MKLIKCNLPDINFNLSVEDEYYDVEVFQEQKVYDTQVDVVNNNVVVSFKYDALSGLNYNPYSILLDKNFITGTEYSSQITNLSSKKLTQSAYTSRQDPDGFYEYVYSY